MGAPRPRRSDRDRVLGTMAAVAALTVAGAVLLPRLFHAAGGPEPDILVALKSHEQDGVSIPISGVQAPLKSEQLHFDRITVNVAPEGTRARVALTLDFTGTVGETRVSALGLEVTSLTLRDGEWRPDSSWLPTLAGAVAALVKRTQVLTESELNRVSGSDAGSGFGSGSVEARVRRLMVPADGDRALRQPALRQVMTLTERRYRARAWYLRADRQPLTGETTVAVTEEFRLEGNTPNRPVDDKRSVRLNLVRVGQEFLFKGGLM